MTEPRSHSSALCQFPFSDGRRCRMLRHESYSSLCLFHGRADQQLVESRQLGAEIAATFTGSLPTAADVNHVLGKVLTALAQNRISQRNAATLAYLGALMLRSLPTPRPAILANSTPPL
jgi:hypothetical protein